MTLLKLFIMNLLLLCVFTFINKLIFISQIEKHSVHPIYGEYPQKTFKCAPWDSCK
jgi:uncharacterized membrane protein